MLCLHTYLVCDEYYVSLQYEYVFMFTFGKHDNGVIVIV